MARAERSNILSNGINQPPDTLQNGVADMCESCPDAWAVEDTLGWSFGLDEYRRIGEMLNANVHDVNSDKNTKKVIKWRSNSKRTAPRA